MIPVQLDGGALLFFGIVAGMAGILIGSIRRAVTGDGVNINRRLQEMDLRLLAAERKLHEVVVEVQHLPSADDFRAMADRVGEVGGDLKAVQASVQSLHRVMERVDEWLIASSNRSGSA
ncbi:DUF2730 family protein [Camelimonas lactis]|uniref:Uncharacterized protein DUF2730 n=1 Tax=Camelimonas lactis TaxID=659006 RepID=A0A4V2RXR4_9HYPH|nr:DUF2730 family protein [Camelimonas lactis]TCO15197.1 uncharacterized protein DUF2730 [Camelimonas lactis]